MDSVLALAGAGNPLLPFLLPLALWKLLDRGPIAGCFVALIALIPIMTGLIQRFSIMAGVDLPRNQAFLNNHQVCFSGLPR